MSRPDDGIYVPAGGDRLRERRKVFGTREVDVKVSTHDTGGGCFVVEITDHIKGGPPRHLHLAQEEWFYVIESEYVVEVGDERYSLGPGDSVLAPREVPHVWAHVREGRGRMLIVFQPAGEMEAFFAGLAEIEGVPQREEIQRLFSEHGMEMSGPPLEIQ